LKDIIEQAEEGRHRSIYIALKPYIDGLKAKIKSLTQIYNLIDNFVKNINNFLHDKKLDFDFVEGIEIKSDSSKLEVDLLSSGEKQLLLLFCNLLPARDNPSIFIIDEPEISLNVEWQRNLIPALLELTDESPIQFIFATHSIEFLTQYEENVIDLVPIQNN
jgi:ABC-type glutathione transport system ATPase component